MPETVENLKNGDVDSYGRIVRNVLAKEPDRYIIYETVSYDVVVLGPESRKCNHSGMNKAIQQIADLKIQHPMLRKKYNSRVAYAYRVAIEGNPADAETALKSLLEDMENLLTRRATLAYRLGALAAAIVPPVAFAIAYCYVASNELGVRLFYAAISGAIGGFLSVVLASRRLDIDLKDSTYVNVVYGSFRIAIAVISAVIMVFLIRADLLLGPLKKAENIEGFIIACVAAGFSERLVPNMLRDFEGAKERDHQ